MIRKTLLFSSFCFFLGMFAFFVLHVVPCISQDTSKREAQQNPLLFFFPSYLSTDNRMLAVEFWLRDTKGSLLKKDVGFLNLAKGELLPKTLKHTLPELLAESYMEGEGLSWDWTYPERIYFTLQTLGRENHGGKFRNALLRYNVITSTLETIPIRTNRDGILFPLIGRDGNHVFFLTYRGKLSDAELTVSLCTHDLQSGNTQILGMDVDLFKPVLSPDGARLLFRQKGDLWLIPTSGGYPKRLTTFNGNSRIISVFWEGGKVYFVRLTPSYDQLSKKLMEFYKSKHGGEGPSYTKELWEVSFSGERPRLRQIESFRTMKLGTDLRGGIFVIPLPFKERTSSIWRYELQEGALQLTRGENMDDLPIIVPAQRWVVFRRDATKIYYVDIEG